MRSRRYQNSYCRGNWLHKFQIIKQTKDGVLERCDKCGLEKHFSVDVPNHIYLSYHLRSGLQIYDPMYQREYGQFI